MPSTNSPSVPSKARLGLHLQEVSGQLEIANFPAVCALTERAFNCDAKEESREIHSPPLMNAGKIQFGVCVAWTLNSNGAIDKSSKFGVFVKRLDKTKEVCSVLIKGMQVVNRGEVKHLTLTDQFYSAVNQDQSRGWSPTFGDKVGIQGLNMLCLLNEEKGWLHEGTLKVTCQLSVGHGTLKCLGRPAEPDPHSEVCEALGSLLRNGHFGDIRIKLKDESISVHSQILAARSDVFAAMLSTQMRESVEKEVDLTDLEASAVKAMIRYLYTGATDASIFEGDDEVIGLLHAAHRFDVSSLVGRCMHSLAERLSVCNVLQRLEVADLLACTALRSACLQFIIEHIAEVQATQAFPTWGTGHPALLMEILAALAPPVRTAQAVPAKRQRVSGKGHRE